MRTTGVCVHLLCQNYHLLSAPSVHPDEFESAPAESAGPNAVGVGWGGAADDEDPWAAFEDLAPPPVPIPVTELTSPPESSPALASSASVVAPARPLVASAARTSRVGALSSSSSPLATPLASPAPSERAMSPVASPASVPSTAGMTKEEKAAEMARRKEERKQVRLIFFFLRSHFLTALGRSCGVCVVGGFPEDRAIKRAEEECRCSKG